MEQVQVVLGKLSDQQDRQMKHFIDSYKAVEFADELAHFRLTTESMELVAFWPLAGAEKKLLVQYICSKVVHQKTNGFNATFNISGSLELMWDAVNNRYGIKVANNPFFPCCVRWECACVPHGTAPKPQAPGGPSKQFMDREQKQAGDIQIEQEIKETIVKDDDLNIVIHQGDHAGDVSVQVQKKDDLVVHK